MFFSFGICSWVKTESCAKNFGYLVFAPISKVTSLISGCYQWLLPDGANCTYYMNNYNVFEQRSQTIAMPLVKNGTG